MGTAALPAGARLALVIPVEDPADGRLVDYTDLTDVELRSRREPAEGVFLAEGDKVIRRALSAGYPMRSMLLSPRWCTLMADVIAQVGRAGVPVYLASPEVIQATTGFHVHRGALAAMARRPLPAVADVLAAARRVAVLEDVNNHTNVGLVVRSAAALGMDAVLLSPSCADPLYRRAVKTSMGAVFAIPWTRFERWPAGLDLLREQGFRLVGSTLDDAAVPLPELRWQDDDKVAVLLGSEGHGISERASRRCDLHVRIPMAHGVDSLNVGAAAAVLFYAVATG